MTTINTIEDLLRLLDENPQWVEALRARLLTRQLMELPETFAKFVETTTQALAALQEGQGRLESDIQRIRDDVGMLKGNQARTATLREIGLLARALGLTIKKVLAPEEVASLAESSDTRTSSPMT